MLINIRETKSTMSTTYGGLAPGYTFTTSTLEVDRVLLKMYGEANDACKELQQELSELKMCILAGVYGDEAARRFAEEFKKEREENDKS